MSDFDMSWWYNPKPGSTPVSDAGTPGLIVDPPTGTTPANNYPGSSEGDAAGSIGSGGGGDAVGSDPNQWWQDTSIANPGASGQGNVNWQRVGETAAEWAARIGAGSLGFLEGALLGGNIFSAGKQAYERGDQAGDWLRDSIFKTFLDEGNPNFVGPPSNLANPQDSDVMPGESGYGSIFGGEGAFGELPPDEGWIGRGETRSGWAAGRPGMGAIGGGGSEKWPNWYATRIDDK